MNVLIVEDEPMAQARLAKTLTTRYNDVIIAGMTGSVKETVEWLSDFKRKADVIFMDVELSDGDCFDVFRHCAIDSLVVMVTAYDNFAVKAFEQDCVDYLLKPLDLQALDRSIERCRKQLAPKETAATDVSEYRERILVKISDKIIPIKTEEIAYIYSEDKYTWLVTNAGAKYIIDLPLEVISEGLCPKDFFRISRSCTVRMSSISELVRYQSSRLRIVPQPATSFEMFVSRSRVDDFMNWLEGNSKS